MPFRFFSQNGFWNTPVAANAPLESNSAAVIGELSAEIAHGLLVKNPPWINTTSSSIPIYTVGPAMSTVRVALDPSSYSPALQAAWENVPLPPYAQSAAGSDKVLVVWQPSTDRLWDFWRLESGPIGWHAIWGGAMEHVSSNPGVYGPEAWAGAQWWWGDSASSLEPVGGLITLEDLRLGVINHALGVALPNVRSGVYASPAQRSDGRSSDPLGLPEGAHLRLDPNLNLSALQLPYVTLLIARAAQQYGLYVRDYSPDFAFYAEDPTSKGINPYVGASGYFKGKTPRELLANFPWSHLQLLKMQLHTSG